MSSDGSKINVVTCTSSAYPLLIPQLGSLLKECVDENITMNFIQPFSLEDGECFWRNLEEDIREEKIFVIIAQEGEQPQHAHATESQDPVVAKRGKDSMAGPAEVPVVLGCVILYLAKQPNAKHRGEIGKLIVGKEHRKRRIGKMLLAGMEEEAHKHGLTLLVLDTQTGSGAEQFYARVGYTPIGVLPDVCLAPDTKQFTSCTFFYKKL
ncbi:hypothetical protein GYMLUDRAFT_39386 [Collybiopsis luxurians FD-317 M1]|nr:hypothetical protein GYMLUDRAFT_39386 [Collybiopsis luxurians FD-317 M1]